MKNSEFEYREQRENQYIQGVYYCAIYFLLGWTIRLLTSSSEKLLAKEPKTLACPSVRCIYGRIIWHQKQKLGVKIIRILVRFQRDCEFQVSVYCLLSAKGLHPYYQVSPGNVVKKKVSGARPPSAKAYGKSHHGQFFGY